MWTHVVGLDQMLIAKDQGDSIRFSTQLIYMAWSRKPFEQ